MFKSAHMTDVLLLIGMVSAYNAILDTLYLINAVCPVVITLTIALFMIYGDGAKNAEKEPTFILLGVVLKHAAGRLEEDAQVMTSTEIVLTALMDGI